MNAKKISISMTLLAFTATLYGCSYGGQQQVKSSPVAPTAPLAPTPPPTTPSPPTGAPAPVPTPPPGTSVKQNPATPAGQGVWTTSPSLMPINPVAEILPKHGKLRD